MQSFSFEVPVSLALYRLLCRQYMRLWSKCQTSRYCPNFLASCQQQFTTVWWNSSPVSMQIVFDDTPVQAYSCCTALLWLSSRDAVHQQRETKTRLKLSTKNLVQYKCLATLCICKDWLAFVRHTKVSNLVRHHYASNLVTEFYLQWMNRRE